VEPIEIQRRRMLPEPRPFWTAPPPGKSSIAPPRGSSTQGR
jgi:hypothetical protein